MPLCSCNFLYAPTVLQFPLGTDLLRTVRPWAGFLGGVAGHGVPGREAVDWRLVLVHPRVDHVVLGARGLKQSHTDVQTSSPRGQRAS